MSGTDGMSGTAGMSGMLGMAWRGCDHMAGRQNLMEEMVIMFSIWIYACCIYVYYTLARRSNWCKKHSGELPRVCMHKRILD